MLGTQDRRCVCVCVKGAGTGDQIFQAEGHPSDFEMLPSLRKFGGSWEPMANAKYDQLFNQTIKIISKSNKDVYNSESFIHFKPFSCTINTGNIFYFL